MIAEQPPRGSSVSCVAVAHRYGRRRALDDVSWNAGPGLTAILGRNGAGKTTLLRIIVTLLKPSGGHVTIDGHDTIKDAQLIRRSLGYLPQEFLPFPELTVAEFLRYVAAIGKISDSVEVDRVIAATHLERYARVRTSALSGGTKRRLGVAQALLGDPTFLVIDEPTAGLDAEERVRLRQLIAQIATRATVLLSTHLMEDVAALAQRVIVIDQGLLLYDGSRGELVARARGRVRELTSETPNFAKPGFLISRATPEAESFRLRVVGPPGAQVGSPVEPSLEDGYLALLQEQDARTGTDA